MNIHTKNKYICFHFKVKCVINKVIVYFILFFFIYFFFVHKIRNNYFNITPIAAV